MGPLGCVNPTSQPEGTRTRITQPETRLFYHPCTTGHGRWALLREGVLRVCTVHTAYSVIGFSVKSGIMSILGWYRFPYSNNYWKMSKIGYSANGFGKLAETKSSNFGRR